MANEILKIQGSPSEFEKILNCSAFSLLKPHAEAWINQKVEEKVAGFKDLIIYK